MKNELTIKAITEPATGKLAIYPSFGVRVEAVSLLDDFDGNRDDGVEDAVFHAAKRPPCSG